MKTSSRNQTAQDRGGSAVLRSHCRLGELLPWQKVKSSGFPFSIHSRGWRQATSFCLILLLVGCQKAIEPSGTQMSVRRVASGQALEIVSASGQTATPQKVRLIGIDTPDLKQQPWGIEAKQRLKELVESKSVRLEFDVEKQDRYGRSLAYVWVGNRLVNEQLVATGYALAIPRSPNVKYQEQLQRAQESARLMGRGIWKPGNPLRQTPTEFRRQNQSRLIDLETIAATER